MAARRRTSKSSTPLDDRQRKLLEEQEKLRAKMDQLNRMIEDAPRIKAERVRAQRNELVDRGTRAVHRLNSSTLADSRFDHFPGTAPKRGRRRTLKSERRQARLIFFALLVGLAIGVFILLSVWHKQWGM